MKLIKSGKAIEFIIGLKFFISSVGNRLLFGFFMENSSSKSSDIFKILSHEVRRRIILFIGDNEFANFTQLSRIEPKPGKLYYHLKLMRGLVTQVEGNLYTLTDLGRRVYRILKNDVFPKPMEQGWSLSLLRPQMFFIFNKFSSDALFLLSFFLIGAIAYVSNIFGVAFVPFYVLESRFSTLLTIGFFALNGLLLLFFMKEFGRFSFKVFSMAIFSYSLAISSIFVSYLLVEYTLSFSQIISLLIILVFQVFGLLIYSSGLSVSFKTTFRKGVVLPLVLHYFSSSLIYLRII